MMFRQSFGCASHRKLPPRTLSTCEQPLFIVSVTQLHSKLFTESGVNRPYTILSTLLSFADNYHPSFRKPSVTPNHLIPLITA
jgi:hypothetical protein